MTWLDRMKKRAENPKAKPENLFAPYRNSWEKRVADFLEIERLRGVWAAVHYERASFKIVPSVGSAKPVRYEPDFICIDPHGRIVFVECKGHMRPEAPNKLKALQAMFPGCGIFIAYIEAGKVCFVPFS